MKRPGLTGLVCGLALMGLSLQAGQALAQGMPQVQGDRSTAGNAVSSEQQMRQKQTQNNADDRAQMTQYDQRTLDINKTRTDFSPIAPEVQVKKMGRGVNIIGYDPYWQDGGKGNYKDKHFKAIRDAGFSTVRVVLFTFDHMGPDGELDPAWLKKLDWVVDTALKYKLNVILDEHDFDQCSKDSRSCGVLLRAMWKQLATRYQTYPNLVMFEILNEPHDKLDADTWNALFPQVLAVIRTTNPERNVIVGPTHWNSRNDLAQLKLPEDDAHLIATFHYYDPFPFTHQGASWAPPEISGGHDIGFGTDAEVAQINADFDAVQAWATANRRPVLLGEFGAYDKAPMESRVKWTSTVARAAEAHGFAWTYWQFSSDFILYDFDKQAFVQPILQALVPPGAKK